MNRYLNFDIAKAICIILVVIGHYFPDDSPIWYAKMREVIYSFHMPLFMFASGFIYIATKKVGGAYVAFVIKKFRRLMIPYFTTSFIIISLKLLAQGNAYIENPVTAYSYFKVFYSPEAGYFLWFIWALWWMFLITPLFTTIQCRLVLLIASFIMHFSPLFLPDLFCLKQLQQFFVYFMLGVFTYDMGFDTLKRTKGLFSVLFITLSIISQLYINNFIMSFLIAIVGVCMIIEMSNIILNQKKIKNVLVIVSVSSYIIYLFHTTFEGFAKAAIKKIPILYDGSNVTGFSIGAFFVIMCGVIIPIVLHRFVFNKYELTKIMFGVK